jgi:hypothetical protein
MTMECKGFFGGREGETFKVTVTLSRSQTLFGNAVYVKLRFTWLNCIEAELHESRSQRDVGSEIINLIKK